MKKRTHKQIMVSKAIYKKYVERYRANDYPASSAADTFKQSNCC